MLAIFTLANDAGNMQHLNILISVVSLLVKALQNQQQQMTHGRLDRGEQLPPGRIKLLNQFLFEHGLDNINLFRIVRCDDMTPMPVLNSISETTIDRSARGC